MQAPAQPQGIDAIMAALQSGGQPTGNIANLPGPVNPVSGISALDPNLAGAGIPPMPGMPGAPQSGAIDPMAGAMSQANPQMVQAIIEALLGSGAFNAQQGPPVAG